MLHLDMTKFLIVALLTTSAAFAQHSATPIVTTPTDRERVQADRAKAAEDEKGAPATRPWDRDADGKRPWERQKALPK